MFETRNLTQRIALQIVLSILVLPFLFPLIVMVQGSLQGAGWSNYKAVLDVPGVWRFFVNTIIITAGVVIIVYVGDDARGLRVRQAAHPRQGTVLLAPARVP